MILVVDIAIGIIFGYFFSWWSGAVERRIERRLIRRRMANVKNEIARDRMDPKNDEISSDFYEGALWVLNRLEEEIPQ